LQEITGPPCGGAGAGAAEIGDDSFAAAPRGPKKAASAIITIKEATSIFFMDRGTSPLILWMAILSFFRKGEAFRRTLPQPSTLPSRDGTSENPKRKRQKQLSAIHPSIAQPSESVSSPCDKD
jgi:hypothetical protein